MLICSVFSWVCLCVVFLCVRGRPPLWRGFVTPGRRQPSGPPNLHSVYNSVHIILLNLKEI